TVGLRLAHQINVFSNVAFFAQFAKTQSGAAAFQSGTSSDFFTTGINYSYRLARDWTANVSYTFQERNDTGGNVNANIVSASLIYDFNLYGNPTAISIAERERARQ